MGMTIENLTMMSNIMLVLGIVLVLVALFLYIRLDIYSAWHFVTGRPIKDKKKKEKKEVSSREHGEQLQQSRQTQPVPQNETIPLDFSNGAITTVLSPATECIGCGATEVICETELEIVENITYIHTDIKL